MIGVGGGGGAVCAVDERLDAHRVHRASSSGRGRSPGRGQSEPPRRRRRGLRVRGRGSEGGATADEPDAERGARCDVQVGPAWRAAGTAAGRDRGRGRRDRRRPAAGLGSGDGWPPSRPRVAVRCPRRSPRRPSATNRSTWSRRCIAVGEQQHAARQQPGRGAGEVQDGRRGATRRAAAGRPVAPPAAGARWSAAWAVSAMSVSKSAGGSPGSGSDWTRGHDWGRRSASSSCRPPWDRRGRRWRRRRGSGVAPPGRRGSRAATAARSAVRRYPSAAMRSV